MGIGEPAFVLTKLVLWQVSESDLVAEHRQVRIVKINGWPAVGMGFRL